MVRSPRALTKIAETGVRPPGTRTQPAQSTPSRCRPAMTRSPIASSPGGPPSGAAKLTVPPSRAMATAALAAQPPPMVMNSLDSTLASAIGNSWTRNTSSRTAMPAQRIWAMSDDAPVAFQPRPDDVMRDGDRMGDDQAAGMAAQHHGGDFIAVEPAGVLKLGAIDRELGRQRLRMAANHQRHRERPGLRREIGDAPAFDADLLAGLPPHRLLDGFARLDEPRKARPLALGKARLAAQQAALAIDCQHDDDWIGARKMLGATGRAIAPPARLDRLRGRAALRAEAVARMPAEHGLGLRQRRAVFGRDETAGRDAAQIRDEEIVAAFQRLGRVGIDADREQRRSVKAAEKDPLAIPVPPVIPIRRERGGLREGECRIVMGRSPTQADELAACQGGAGA